MKLTSKIGLERDLYNIPWVSWTPTYAAGAGSITTMTTTHARYKKIGKLVHYSLNLTITNAGTGSGFLTASTPSGLDPVGFNSAGCGREGATSNNQVMVQAAGTDIYMWRYDGSTVIVTSKVINATGWYRIA